MITNYKNLIGGLALIFSIGVNSAPIKKVSNQEDVALTECNVAKTSAPSLWDWLVSSHSSKFHFFQLLELVHFFDDTDTPETVQSNSDENNDKKTIF